MKKAEDLLCDRIEIGGSNLFSVCRDLKQYIKNGLLVELPIDCSLNEVLGLEYIKTDEEYYGNKLTKILAHGKDLTIQFRTVPGGTPYELKFSDSDRTGYYGYFEKK